MNPLQNKKFTKKKRTLSKIFKQMITRRKIECKYGNKTVKAR